MPQFTYYATVVTDAHEYLNAYRRNNVCVRMTKETESILLREVPRIMGYSIEDRYAYAILVIFSSETSEDQKIQQVKVIEELANKNFLPACNILGSLIEEDKYFVREDDNVREWYGFCHENGYAYGTYNYARCLLVGIGGPTDFLLGQKLMEQAANQGLAAAMRFIGDSYVFGENSYPEYYYEARNWYHKASLQLEPHSMYNLGCLYSEGKGGKQDDVEATKWYEKAAYYGHILAMINYGISCKYGKGVPQDSYKAFRYFEKAANLGNAQGIYYLAMCYLVGDGCDADMHKGAKLIDKAASLGNKDAIDYIKRLKEKLEKENAVTRNKETYSDGSWYEGEFKNGKYHGQGTFCWTNGTKYVGPFADGMCHGEGILYYNDGTSEKVTYNNGNVVNKSPNRLRENYNDGSWYEGEFKNGTRHGYGIYRWPDGGVYEGEFLNGNRHGHGIHRYANGNSYDGQYENGSFHGKGKYVWADGSWYEGEFLNGNRHGKGTYYWSNGEKYIGGWNNGLRHGEGLFYLANGSCQKSLYDNGKMISLTTDDIRENYSDGSYYVGEIKDGLRHGKGTYYWSNGDRYIGNWLKGAMHGTGVITYSDGRKEFVTCENGKYINRRKIGGR